LKKNSRAPEKNLLISRLNQWAVKHSLLDDPYLVSVSRAIEKSDSLDFWSTLDPSARLPRPLSKAGANLHRWSRYLSITRNLLVFIPVAITWKAIAEATAAFSEFLAANSATPVNFLDFWQDGYGLLDPIYRIGTIAEIDFWIIILIIATTLVSTSIFNIAKARDAIEQKSLDSERELISLEIHKFLTVPSVVSKGFTEENLNTAVRNLTNATEAIATAAQRFEKVVVRASSESKDALNVVREAKTFQKSVIRALKQVKRD
jgi:hypothetical protein